MLFDSPQISIANSETPHHWAVVDSCLLVHKDRQATHSEIYLSLPDDVVLGL